ncbi:MAG: IPT/TIG domain-containing protein [Tunicatimonas sp.]
MNKLILAALLLATALLTTTSYAQVAGFDERPRNAYTITSSADVNELIAQTNGSDHYLIGQWRDDIAFSGWTSEPTTFYREAYAPGQFFFVIANANASPALRGFTGFGTEPGDVALLSDIAVSGNNVYVLGTFSGTLYVDDDGEPRDPIKSLGGNDLFLIHWDLKGNLQSFNRLGSEGDDFGDRLAIDNDGNLLVAGRFEGSTNFLFDPDDNWIGPVTSDESDLFVAKYQPELGSGSILDLAVLGGSGRQNRVTGLLIDENNEVYVKGQFTEEIWVQEIISNGPGGKQRTTTANSKQVFITRLNQTFAPRWITTLESDQEFTDAGDMDYDVSTKQLLVTHEVRNEPTYQGQSLGKTPQGNDVYVLRADAADGSLINHFLISSPNFEDSKQIVSDQRGNYFVNGTFRNELMIDQGGTSKTLTRDGTQNTFLAAFSTSGSQRADDRLVYLSGFSNAGNVYATRGMTVLNEGSELEVHVPMVFNREAFGLDGAPLQANPSSTVDILVGRYRFPSIPRITEVAPVRTGDRYGLSARGIRLFSSSARDFTYRMGEGAQLLEGAVSGTIDGSDQVYEVELPVPDTWVAGTNYPLTLSKSIYPDFYQASVKIPPVVTPLSADASGTCDETMSLTGRYFGSSSGGVSVAFERDGAEVRSAEVSAVAPTTLTVSVPTVYPQDYQVRVRVNGQEATAGTFRVLPAITQVSNTTALPGGSITVSGCAFIDATHGTNLLGVSLQQAGRAAVEVSTFTVAPEQPNKLELTLPGTLSPGTYALAVTVNGQLAAGDFSIEVVDANTTLPLVTALSSGGEASPGDTVVITGKNLGSDPDLITVEMVEGQLLPVSEVNEAGTELTFVIPPDLPEGSYPTVVVNVGGQRAVGSLAVQVVPEVEPLEELAITLAPDNPTAYEPTEAGLTLRTQVAGKTDNDIVQLVISGLSDDQPQEVATQLQNDEYQAVLSESQLDDPLGIEYRYVVKNGPTTRGASDALRVYRRYPDQPMTLYKADQAEPTQADYQLVSVPFRTQNVRDAMTGPQTFSPDSIRLLRYATGSSAYQEFGTDFNDLEPGRGYWLVKRAGVPLSVKGTAVEVDAARSFTIPLKEGWNLIGNPFPFEVGTDWLGTLDQRVFRRDQYAEGDGTLRAYEGLFVESTIDTVVQVSAVSDRNARTSRSTTGISQFANHALDDAAWFIGFTLSTSTVTNALAGFGMHPRAQPGYDTYDATLLPRFQRFVEMQIDNELTTKRLERDIVTTTDQHTWRFKVAADPSAQEVRLAWNSHGWGRNDRGLWLRDELTQRLINLREVSGYSFSTGADPRAFTLFYGPQEGLSELMAVPQVQVGAGYPNPATDRVVIPMSIPTAKIGSIAFLTLTDATGRIVRSEQKRLSSGFNELSWNRRDNYNRTLPAGMYFYRLRVGNQKRYFTGKIIYHE